MVRHAVDTSRYSSFDKDKSQKRGNDWREPFSERTDVKKGKGRKDAWVVVNYLHGVQQARCASNDETHEARVEK